MVTRGNGRDGFNYVAWYYADQMAKSLGENQNITIH